MRKRGELRIVNKACECERKREKNVSTYEEVDQDMEEEQNGVKRKGEQQEVSHKDCMGLMVEFQASGWDCGEDVRRDPFS
jgi:hypothetical protein